MTTRGAIREQREGTGGRNVRYSWLVLTYALAADIFYRAGFARETFGQIADLLFIWLGAQVFYVILEMSATGVTMAAFRAMTIPTMALAIVVAAGALLMTTFWSAAVVSAGVAALALMAVLALLVNARRRV